MSKDISSCKSRMTRWLPTPKSKFIIRSKKTLKTLKIPYPKKIKKPIQIAITNIASKAQQSN